MSTKPQPWDALRFARLHAKVTVTDFALTSGYARSYLHKLEAGTRQPTMTAYARLADALGMKTAAATDPGDARAVLAPPPAIAALLEPTAHRAA